MPEQPRVDRMPPLPDERLTEDQRSALAQITAGPRGAAVGPFVVLLRSPELMNRVQKVGEYLRYEKAMPSSLFEMAILVIARYWDQEFEWAHHHPIALREGVAPSVVAAIGEGRRPEGMSDAETVVWEVLDELLHSRHLSDDVYARALGLLGEDGVVELVVTAGYYTTLAMVMNVAQTPPEAGAVLPPRSGGRR